MENSYAAFGAAELFSSDRVVTCLHGLSLVSESMTVGRSYIGLLR